MRGAWAALVAVIAFLHIPAGLDTGVKESRAELPEELKAEANNLGLILDDPFPSEIHGRKVLTVLVEYRAEQA